MPLIQTPATKKAAQKRGFCVLAFRADYSAPTILERNSCICWR